MYCHIYTFVQESICVVSNKWGYEGIEVFVVGFWMIWYCTSEWQSGCDDNMWQSTDWVSLTHAGLIQWRFWPVISVQNNHYLNVTTRWQGKSLPNYDGHATDQNYDSLEFVGEMQGVFAYITDLRVSTCIARSLQFHIYIILPPPNLYKCFTARYGLQW